jgi:uncharacterized protein YndB with AHSA1/START domain
MAVMTRTDSASRLVAASPSSVYDALIDPDALVEWLPPDGMSGRFEWFEPRNGGGYRLVLTYSQTSAARGKAGSDTDVVETRFVELVPGERVVQSVTFESDDPAFSGTMTMIWELAATEEGTRVQIRAHDVPPGISAEDHAAGLTSSLANLAAYLGQ